MTQFKEMWELLEKFTFEVDAQLLIHVKCVICGKLLIDAHEGLCGCNYCLKCITKYLQDGIKKCPGDSIDCNMTDLVLHDNVIRSNSTNRKISKLRIVCPSKNCDFECELHAMHEHLRFCDKRSVNCPYMEIGCQKSPIPTDKISTHLISDMQEHAQLLVGWIINMKNEISLSDIDYTIGKHTNDISKNLENLQNNEYEVNIKTLNKNLQDLNEKYVEVKNELKTIKSDHEIEIKQLKNFVQEYQNQDPPKAFLEGCLKSIQNVQEKISVEENLPEDPQEQETIMSVSLLKIEELDKTSENQFCQIATFIWTITDIARIKKKNVVIDSDNFFSKNDDLKMRLDMFNGNKNKIRIRFYISSGNKNSKFKSPSSCVVTITIKDFNNSDASQSLSKRCDFSKPKFNSFYETFEFFSSNLEQTKVLQSNAILIECVVDAENY